MPWRSMFLTVATCFLAGSTFVHWIADHNTVWRNPTTDEAARTAITYYEILAGSSSPAARGDSAMLENLWLVIGLVAIVLCGSRAANGMLGIREDDNESNGGYLFDGACTVLLLRVVFVQWSEVYPAINSLLGTTGKIASEGADFETAAETARGLASRNLSISVALTGVILLQAGRYYSERSYEKSRLSDEQADLVAAARLAQAVQDGNAPTDSEYDSLTDDPAKLPLKKRGRAQTPYRELSEGEAMEFKSGQ
ncbi:hypothetical protein QFC20_002383 [Naganishia adeliensis]|uniref:Uncharacterized protein n=1 Tax=Naganishia adeliensis TaxID=92952 RepID=A0ACC2WNT2_9TREE|nr:hypothetical protein QFC20_002383 [Naganishia adeliensis]